MERNAVREDEGETAKLRDIAEGLRLPWPFAALPHYRRIAGRVASWQQERGAPLVVGVCGSQGSGKSTLASFVAALLEADGLAVATLSLDDLYLDPEERPVSIHPLFATRGVPGTHDVALGLAVIDGLVNGPPDAITLIPRFDKARDRRAPRSEWTHFSGRADVVILEGWCVGTPPQPDAALAEPINALEADEDGAGLWRRHVNASLAGAYQALFDRLSMLIFLAAPSFDCVFAWRQRQEQKLRVRVGADAPAVMDDRQIERFIQHYERLTRHALAVLPGRADMLCRLDADQAIVALLPYGESETPSSR